MGLESWELVVLKNVGKIERFVVDQLRRFLDEEFIFPSYYSLNIVSPSSPPPPTDDDPMGPPRYQGEGTDETTTGMDGEGEGGRHGGIVGEGTDDSSCGYGSEIM